MNNCSNCKNWRVGSYKGMGILSGAYCMLTEVSHGGMIHINSKSAALPTDYWRAAVLFTTPDFYCNQWEQKIEANKQ